jgi:hypothetical protein
MEGDLGKIIEALSNEDQAMKLAQNNEWRTKS